MSLSNHLSGAAVAVAVICAVVSTGIVVRREFFPPAQHSPAALTPPVAVSHWEKYLTGGHRLGPANAKLTIVEFVDFECPFCKQLALGPLRHSMQRHPDMAVIIRQRPMPYHRFAYPAARAAECAASQGRFPAFHDALFERQDSLGLKSFVEFARTAGVPDLDTFNACTAVSSAIPGVDRDVAAGDSAGVFATPSIIVNGMLITGAPDSAHLEKYIVDALARQGQRATRTQ